VLKITLLLEASAADLGSAYSLVGSSFLVSGAGSSILGFSPSKAELVLLLEILYIPRPVN